MEIPDRLHCLFSTELTEQEDRYVFEVPKRELRIGDITAGTTYRVAVLPAPSEENEPPNREPESESSPQEPPVEEGDIREVEIETIGDQGDGLARVDRGFVVVVPETGPGERVKIEITDVKETVAFATVSERLDKYEAL